MKSIRMILFAAAVLQWAFAASAVADNIALANLSSAQIDALRQAVSFAEPADTVRTVFEDIAVGTPGTSQQDLLKSRLRSDNLSFLFMVGAINQNDNAAGYEYGHPALEQIATSSMRTVERGTVIATDDLTAVQWNPAGEGRFAFDTGTGYKGVCLFHAKQDGEAWKIVRLAIQKTGSDQIEDGYPVFNLESAP